MALQTTLVDLSFTQGADNKADPKQVGLTSFLTLQNSRYSKIGAAVPRGGFTPFSTLPNPNGSVDLLGDNDYLIAKNGGYNLLIGASNNYNRLGQEMPGAYKRLYAGESIAKISTVGAYSTGGTDYIIQVWATPDNATTGNVGVALYDAATERVLAKGVQGTLGVVYSMKIVLIGGLPYLVYENASHVLTLVQINVTATSTSQILSGGLTWTNAPSAITTLRWAIATSGSSVCVLWASDGATTTKLQIFTNPGSATAGTNTMTFTDPARAIAVTNVTTQGTAVFMTCATSDGSTGSPVSKVRFYTAGGTAVGTEQTQTITTSGPIKSWAYETSTSAYYGVTCYTSVAATRAQNYQMTVTPSSISLSGPYAFYATPVTGADIEGLMIMDAQTDTTYGSQAMIKMSSFTSLVSHVGSVGVGMNLGQSLLTEQTQLDKPVVVGSKTFFNCPVITAVESLVPPTGSIGKLGIVAKTQASLIVWDSAELVPSYLDRSKQQALYMGASTRVAGASERTGTAWPETSTRTEDLSIVAGTRINSTSTVSYVFAKVWKSAEGVEYRTYSPIFTVKFANNTSTLQYVIQTSELETYSPTSKVTGIELYRTEENGIIFYLAATQRASGTFTDTSTDATIIGARTADLNGNELPPQAIPSLRAVSNFADRIAMVSADKPSTILFDRPSFYPVGTSTANGLEVEVSTEGGDITALQDMDSALYIFKANTISSLYGDPPSATGEGSSLGTPKILFNGTGCLEPRSVILTPQGILFKSGKGFYVIARNQQLAFIGEGPFGSGGLVTGAIMSQNQYEVIFTHDSGSTWVLNLDTRAWYEWTSAAPMRGVAISSGDIYFINDSSILKYSESSTIDLGVSNIAQDIRTGWVVPSHIRGFQRVRRAYIEASCSVACQLTVQIYVDYSATAVQTVSYSLTPGNVTQIDLHLKVQKCESMSFRFTTDKAGLTLSGATLEIGLKGGGDKSRVAGSNF